MVEMLLAALGLGASLALLVRLGLGSRRRHRIDAAVSRTWRRTSAQVMMACRWPASRRKAVKLANEAILRARGQHPTTGNVIRPKSFRERRKLH